MLNIINIMMFHFNFNWGDIFEPLNSDFMYPKPRNINSQIRLNSSAIYSKVLTVDPCQWNELYKYIKL